MKIEEACRVVDPVFLNMPQFHSEPLSDTLGMKLILKVETVNPIRSFKGRGADFFTSQLPGEIPKLVCSSAGNFGQGLAYAARKRGFHLTVFGAESASPMKVECMRQLGAEVRLSGQDLAAAKQLAKEFARATGALFVEDGFEPAISEGAGTIAVELCRWPEPLDFLVVPLGDGALLSGLGRWMKTHSPQTRLVAVVVDEVLLVNDDSIIQAMQLTFRHHGLVTEPAGAAGLAALIAYKERFNGAVVATILTGGNLASEQIRQWLSGAC